jgi:hypothetical protein
MTRFIRRRLPVIALLAVLLAGGTVAAMAAANRKSSHAHHASVHHQGKASPPRGQRLLQTATSYIGMTPEALEQGLRSGKSLGQMATEAGKTEAGLVQALASSARAGLEERIAQAVKQPGGGLPGLHHHGHPLRVAAAAYLGLTPAALSAQLHAGRTLAQIADSTPGRTRAALIDALVAARLSETPAGHLAKPGAKGATNGARRSKAAGRSRTARGSSRARAARIRRRVTAQVDHGHLAKQSHPPGG